MDARELEPVVGLHMQRVVLVAQFLRTNSLFESLSLCCSSVLVCATYVEGSPVPRTWAEFSGRASLSTTSMGLTVIPGAGCKRESETLGDKNVPRKDIGTQGTTNDVTWPIILVRRSALCTR